MPADGAGSGDAATHRALANESRRELLAVLRRQRRPLDASEAAEAIGLQRNTARVHLDVLVSAGLVRRRTEQRAVPGRPRVLYEASRGDATSRSVRADAGYHHLARVLAGQLNEVADARSEAIRAGRRWAASFDGSTVRAQSTSPDAAVRVVVRILDDLGFQPEPLPKAHPSRILLHHCPFADVARESRAVVCGIHLGMVEATLERLDTPVVVDGLDSFVTDDPLLCVVRFSNRGTQIKPRQPGARRDHRAGASPDR
ncbi:MAG: helix-turn-helix transcriptional regulator [Acidimicrobiales bacterium]